MIVLGQFAAVAGARQELAELTVYLTRPAARRRAERRGAQGMADAEAGRRCPLPRRDRGPTCRT
jgi:hypothetical protein